MLLPEPDDVLPEAEVLFDEVEPEADPEASPLPEVEPLALGEAEVSPLVLPLALPLGELMLPVDPVPDVLPASGVELVEPAAPPVVEVEEPEVLGVCAGLEVSVLGVELDGVCEADPMLLLGLVELDGVCVASVLLLGLVDWVEVELDGVCVASVLLLGIELVDELDDGVELWSVDCVLVLPPDVELPVVCASIIRLNANTSETINKTFFMLFSNTSLDGAFGEAKTEIPVRTFISSPLRCTASASGWLRFNTGEELRLRLKSAILLPSFLVKYL